MANAKPLAKAEANIKKNRLHITISGNIDIKSLEKLYTEIRFCVADLKKGFEVISDISQCNLLYISSLPVYKKIIDFLIAKNIGEVVRIIKKDNISYKQIVNFSEKIHCYRAVYAENKEDAEKKLECLIKRDGIRFPLNNVLFHYERNNEAGSGRIVDISISGCAVESATLPLAENDAIGIIITFDKHETLPSEFHLKACVVRRGEHLFAARFIDVDDERKAKLYQRLAYEVGRSSSFF
ncbi:PilZ domain-containing protein [uncultured Desulfobulbus sp.]|uniref:PilZ domain-containing protein n=1 Tax=uncultured Desulfobulbus sp. TaxID=239745 RepID=UPI0029C9116A|nr:PilZ domain-containing protein [uncultured Desulfobulbus sp.]